MAKYGVVGSAVFLLLSAVQFDAGLTAVLPIMYNGAVPVGYLQNPGGVALEAPGGVYGVGSVGGVLGIGGVSDGITVGSGGAGLVGTSKHLLPGGGIGLVGAGKHLLSGGYEDGYLHRGDQGGSGGFTSKGQAVGDTGYHTSDRYLDDARHVGDKLAQGGYYDDVRSGQRNLQDGGLYQHGQAFNRGGKVKSEMADNNGFRKGHHSSGFHTSYHKDESGRDTNYYDDDHDEGQHNNMRDFGDFYNTRGLDAAQGDHQRGQFVAGARGEQQHFGKGLHQDASVGQRGAYSNRGSYGQEAAQGMRSGGAGSYGSGQAMGYLH